MSDTFTVIKRDHTSTEQLRYTGKILERGATWVCLEARFGFSDRDLGYATLRKGDRFTEWFYSDRWYNVFRIEDVHSGNLKGWYCNITRPAEIDAAQVASDDLALDIFVKPSGETLVLDEDEFEALALSPQEQQAARDAIQQILDRVKRHAAPFDELR